MVNDDQYYKYSIVNALSHYEPGGGGGPFLAPPGGAGGPLVTGGALTPGGVRGDDWYANSCLAESVSLGGIVFSAAATTAGGAGGPLVAGGALTPRGSGFFAAVLIPTGGAGGAFPGGAGAPPRPPRPP